MKKIKVIVEYPWYGIKDDECIVEIEENENENIGEIAFDYALDMILDRGVRWDYEEI